LSGSTPVSVLLYATMAGEAREEQIDIREPAQWSTKGPASVILHPVPLLQLAALLDPSRTHILAAERQLWVENLVTLRARKPPQTARRQNFDAA